MLDLREFIEKLVEHGELKTIDKEVHWDQEAAAICAMANRVGAPAVWFKKIKGYPKGRSLVGGTLTGPGTHFPVQGEKFIRKPWTRTAIALELEPSISYVEIMDQLMERSNNPLNPTELSTGPCKEVIKRGANVDIFELPIPHIHHGDGGRYLTLHNLIVKDPDTGAQDWGCTRIMALEKDILVGSFLPRERSIIPIRGDYTWKIFQKYEAQNRPMPFCIAIGGDPTGYIASMMHFSEGVSKAAIAGGLSLSPLEVVTAETCDLMVPAKAEIIIEGEVLPNQRASEGPYEEWTIGFTPPMPQPIMKIKAITHRKDPILPFQVEGCKVWDSMAILSLTASMDILQCCRANNMRVRWVNVPPDWGLGAVVVSTKNYFNGYLFWLSRTIFTSNFSHLYDKIFVVEDDVPPIDLFLVMGDWMNKNNMLKDIHFMDGAPFKSPILAYDRPGEAPLKTSTRVYYDCTWPLDWRKEDIPPRVHFEFYPEPIKKLVLERWKDYYGLKSEPIFKEYK